MRIILPSSEFDLKSNAVGNCGHVETGNQIESASLLQVGTDSSDQKSEVGDLPTLPTNSGGTGTIQMKTVFEGTIVPNGPIVVSETMHGESIIMHHAKGYYFDTTGTGSLVWEAIEAGTTVHGLTRRLAQACDLGEGEARATVLRFLETLHDHDLIKTGDAEPNVLAEAAPMAFAEPELRIHDDLEDILLLDPVHDVGEQGWPAPPPDFALKAQSS